MPRYATLFKFNTEAVKGMVENPSDRAAALRETFAGAGGQLDAYYWMLGTWDGMVIASAPDSAAFTSVMVTVAASGALAHMETHELIDADEIGSILGRAKDVAYRAPGS